MTKQNISKMIVVGSSCQGYKTAADYLTKTELGSAVMAFFPHINPHVIRDSLKQLGKPYEFIRKGVVISPGVFYIGASKKCEVTMIGDYASSSGLHRRFSVKDCGGKKQIKMHSRYMKDTIGEAFMEMYNLFEKNTVCVILRGAGWDGVDAAKYIKEHGGRVIIEDLPNGGMTNRAREIIHDAEIVSPEDIPKRLEEIISS
jgi:chemotaxis response regulator CheB